MFERILVAVDGSPTSNRGLKTAIDLAADQQAALHVLHIVDALAGVPSLEGAYFPTAYLDQMSEALRDTGREVLKKAESMAAARGVQAKVALVESVGHTVAQAILGYARKQRADLIVLGTHGRRGLSRALMGSDAEMVLREARVPVLMVRAPAAAPSSPGRRRGVAKPAPRPRAQAGA